jgi:hypothetical protein
MDLHLDRGLPEHAEDGYEKMSQQQLGLLQEPKCQTMSVPVNVSRGGSTCCYVSCWIGQNGE